jgi:DNA polymerase III gamma/tau subunit
VSTNTSRLWPEVLLVQLQPFSQDSNVSLVKLATPDVQPAQERLEQLCSPSPFQKQTSHALQDITSNTNNHHSSDQMSDSLEESQTLSSVLDSNGYGLLGQLMIKDI